MKLFCRLLITSKVSLVSHFENERARHVCYRYIKPFYSEPVKQFAFLCFRQIDEKAKSTLSLHPFAYQGFTNFLCVRSIKPQLSLKLTKSQHFFFFFVPKWNFH